MKFNTTKRLILFLSFWLLWSGPALAGYQASPPSVATGDDSTTTTTSTPLELAAVASQASNTVSFTVSKSDNSTFTTAGTMLLQIGCGSTSASCQVVGTKAVTNGDSSIAFSNFYMPDYVTGTTTKQFFARYEANTGYWAWVGPIEISAPSLATPGSLSSSSIAAGSAKLNWGTSTGSDSFRYQVTTDTSFSTSTDGATCFNCISGGNSTTTSLFANLSGLTANQTYRWRVRAGNSVTGQGSPWSAMQSFTTLVLNPSVGSVTVSPTSVSAGTTQTVSWVSSNQSWYFFFLYNSSGNPVDTSSFLSADCAASGSGAGAQGCLGQTNPSSAQSDSWTVPASLAAGQYKIKVAVWNSSTPTAAGAFSPLFTVNPPPPPTVSGVTLSPTVLGEGQTLTVSWNASNQHHYTYMLYDDDQDVAFDTSSFLSSSCPAGSGLEGCLGFFTSSTQRSSNWLVPNAAPHGRFRIKVAVWNEYGTAVGAFSAPFTLGPTVDNVTVSPSSVRLGDTQTISWTSTKQSWYMAMLYNAAGSLPIDTTAYNFPSCVAAGPGAGAGGCITQTNPSAAQSTSWTLPANLPVGSYTIKVAVWNNTTDSQGGFSAPFTVSAPQAQISQLTLDRTILRGGESQTVSWSSTNQNYYEVNLLNSTGTPVDTSLFLGPGCSSGSSGCLGKGTTAKTLSWTPPLGFSEGQYRVKVSLRYAAGDTPSVATSSLFDVVRSYLNVSSWAQDAAAYLVANGIVVAPANGDLRGTSAMNRAELATLLYRSLGGGHATADAYFSNAYGGVPAPVFSDVADPDVWYHRPVTYLGLLSYSGDPGNVTVFNQEPGIFRPAQTISRAWTLKALLEAIDQPPLSSFAGVSLYSDVSTSHPAAGYIYKAQQLGIISSSSASPTFRPDESANREDLFVMLHRGWDSTANLLQLAVAIPNPVAVDFERSTSLGRIGYRYEQPILNGVTPPSFELSVFGPRQETLGNLAGIYTADLTATITSWDQGSHTDIHGVTYSADLFCAWEASGGSFINQTTAGMPDFCSVKWIAPIDVSAANGGPATYEITLYVGDGLGSEVKTVHQLTIGDPSSDPTLPTITFDELPGSRIGGQLLEFSGSVADGGDPGAANFGILKVEVFSSSDNGVSWSSRGKADLLGGGRWSHAWLLPPITGNRLFRAEATNLRGNRQVSAPRSITIEPWLSLEGQVVDSYGVAQVNVPVRLTGGGLDVTQLSDNQGAYLFDNLVHGLSQGIPYQVEAVSGPHHSAVAGLVLSGSTTTRYSVLRLDTAPPFTVASPAAGQYRDPIQVTLICTDQDTECVATHFTLDGSSPTAASPTYSGPISIGTDTTLKFFSIDFDGNREPASELQYTFDSCQPPATGDWVISTSCTYNRTAAAPASVIVEPGAVLTIEPGAILEIDLHTYKLLVRQGGGVKVRLGGTVRQKSGTLNP